MHGMLLVANCQAAPHIRVTINQTEEEGTKYGNSC